MKITIFWGVKGASCPFHLNPGEISPYPLDRTAGQGSAKKEKMSCPP
jgi:hypothetical protein